MVPEQKNRLDILQMNQAIYKTLQTKERKVDGEEICDKHAKRIWHEIEKELLYLAHDGKLVNYHVASIDLYSASRVIVTYHKKSSEELKSYDVPKEVDANRIFIRMCLLAEKAGFSMAPSHQLSSRGRITWWIRFADTQGK